MWIVAGALLGTTLLAVLVGFHAGPHGHLLAGLTGIAAAGWLVAMAATGRATPLLYLLLGADLALSLGVGFGAWRALREQRTPQRGPAGLMRLEGLEGIAIGGLHPEGVVRVRGEQWSAMSLNGPIEPGATVQVIRADGIRLEVWGDEAGRPL